MRNKAWIAALVVVAWFVNRGDAAWAWGVEGHQIVAMIADRRLNDSARAQVADLLGAAKMFEVASWPDQIRKDRPETGPWHYVDIPVDAPAFDEARDGQHGDNVVDQINRWTAVLADRGRPQPERSDALKFVIHFVGDIHQPLHCAERSGDKGGNGRLVFFLDQPRALNLHGVWDSSILQESMGNTQVTVYASSLSSRIAPAQAALWSRGTPEQWANEGHDLAVNYVYRNVPVDGALPKLNRDYVNGAKPIVEGQLERAGVRLAMVLNKALGGPATTRSGTPTPVIVQAPAAGLVPGNSPSRNVPATMPGAAQGPTDAAIPASSSNAAP